MAEDDKKADQDADAAKVAAFSADATITKIAEAVARLEQKGIKVSPAIPGGADTKDVAGQMSRLAAAVGELSGLEGQELRDNILSVIGVKDAVKASEGDLGDMSPLKFVAGNIINDPERGR